MSKPSFRRHGEMGLMHDQKGNLRVVRSVGQGRVIIFGYDVPTCEDMHVQRGVLASLETSGLPETVPLRALGEWHFEMHGEFGIVGIRYKSGVLKVLTLV